MQDYQKLCDLDVIDLNTQLKEEETIYQDFKDQLTKSQEKWYETGLLWKPGVDSLPNNKARSLARLSELIQRLEKNPQLYEQNQEIIQEQEEKGIIEKVTQEP